MLKMLKNKKNLLVLIILVLSSCCYSASSIDFNKNEKVAQGWQTDAIKNARKKAFGNGIIAVKIKVEFEDVDFEFLKKSRGLGSKFADLPDVIYRVRGYYGKTDRWNNGELVFLAGYNSFSGPYYLKRQKTIQLDDVSYFFNQSNKMELVLPIRLQADIPPDNTDIIYVGTIVYKFKGNELKLVSVKVIDEFDEAQKKLDELSPDIKLNLCRVEWRPYDPDDMLEEKK